MGDDPLTPGTDVGVPPDEPRCRLLTARAGLRRAVHERRGRGCGPVYREGGYHYLALLALLACLALLALYVFGVFLT